MLKPEYSLVDTLTPNPDSRVDGLDHHPKQVFSGHYVLVAPTPLPNPEYIIHSKKLFHELGLQNEVAQSEDFVKMFTGDLSNAKAPFRKVGWACGYALSIFGREYYHQCPFQTGNGYGDGRAISILETVVAGKRYEMQLKGGGRTPYCRGADGRAVLRSSVREFLAQEAMHALNVPTSRSLSLFVSKTEKVRRPWYSQGSNSLDPDTMVLESAAISTRVASSFLRVGHLELFGRRARKNEYPTALSELESLVLHLIDREYSNVIDQNLSLAKKVLVLASEFQKRLTRLAANWVRVGYCQGNFNGDNCAAGGFTLDYGPFGFMETFDPHYQPWTGGGEHFSFLNQPVAAAKNFQMFCLALSPLLSNDQESLDSLKEIHDTFMTVMKNEMENMWAAKLGLLNYNDELFKELITLLMKAPVDYTIFFRELSTIPNDIEPLKKSFYLKEISESFKDEWTHWLDKWKGILSADQTRTLDEISKAMKLVNPKYILREWLLVLAYQEASVGNYSLVHELNEVMSRPYEEQSKEVEEKFYRLRPLEFENRGGVSHLSCSS